MKRLRFAAIAFVLAVGIIFGISSRNSEAANQNVGYADFSFGNTIGSDPTAAKPQSKLWYNDGSWWAVLFHTGSNTYHIYKLSWPSQWVDTGVVVDDRPLARADCLWDGTHLYIASTKSNINGSDSTNQGRLYRYSYANGVYTLNTGFPVVMFTGSVETTTIDKDTTGQIWVTFTKGSKVYVNRSLKDANGVPNDTNWGTPFVVPGPTTATNLNSDDISSLVAYHDQKGYSIGVVWSNHNTPSSMYFSYHIDGDPDLTWQPIETIYSATCAADDHINLKSLQADPSGTLYAAVKTSFGDSGCNGTSSSPLTRLVVRRPDNTWAVTTFGTVGDDHTRPVVLLDTTNRMVYMFATSPTSCGIIYMKSTSMDKLSFPAGKGTPFISSSTYTCINNATSTKQTVNAATGLVVMASDENKLYYLHNTIDLSGSSTTATPTTATTPSATSMPTSTPTTAATATPTNTPPPGSTATPTSTPGAWSSQDIGTATGGSWSTNGTSVTVNGSGSDIWGSADSFRYTWQPFSGDLVLTAKLTQWSGGGNSWAKGGLMLRGSTAANAANCFVLVSGGNGIRMQWRAATGGSSTITSTGISFAAPSPSAPLWLRLSLSGSSCSAFYSTNGSSWTAVGSPQAIGGLGSGYLYGMAVTAHDTTKLASATFDAIDTGGAPPPSNTPTATAAATQTPSSTPTATSTSTPTPSATSAPTGTPIDTPTSAATSTPTSAPAATPTSTPTPPSSSNWSSQDIGTATGGSWSTNGTSVTVNGSGSDIWGSADSFRYTWQPFSGDLVLTAKLTQWNGGGNSWAKGGLMLRGSTAANATNCFVLVSGGNGIRMQWRAATGGSSTITSTGISFAAPSPSAPLWLRLSLSGTSCSAFYSTNGSSWNAVGAPQAIGSLGSSYLYGLAITAHDTTKLASASFDAITATTP